jgi:hypothetical protein
MKSSLLVLAVVLAACGSSAAPTTAGPADTTTSSTLPIGAEGIELALIGIGPITTLEAAQAVVDVVAEGGDVNFVPYLYDVSRFGDVELFGRAMSVIGELTGESVESDDLRTLSLFYGRWIYQNDVNPGVVYVSWKASLFSAIDPEFGTLLGQVSDPVIAARVQWGGVPRGGIPELNDQPTIPVAEAGYMVDSELVFGAVIDGEARAYPVRILGHHELANDHLGGRPVAMVYCTLCRTPVFFDREVDGLVLDLQTSGLLANSNKVMVDVQTDSLWNALTGEAFAGPLAGTQLERLPFTVTTWADWVAEHPDSDVQTIPEDGPASYTYQPGDAYRDYYASSELWFPTFEVPDVFAEKEEVITLDLVGSRIALRVADLDEAGAVIVDVGGSPVLFVSANGGGRAYEATEGLEVVDGEPVFDGEPVTISEDLALLADGTELFRRVTGQSFWFAWFGNFPDTDWWPKS